LIIVKSKIMQNFGSYKLRSISRTFTIGLIITLVLVAGLSLGVNFILSSRKAKAELETRVEEYTSALTDALKVPLWTYSEETINAICASYAQNEFVAKLLVEGQDGSVIFKKEKFDKQFVVSRSRDIFYEGSRIGRVHISLASGYYTAVNRQLFQSVSLTIFFMIGALLVMTGVLLRQFFKKPMSRFIKMVETYAAGESRAFKQGTSYSEFHPLVNVLDEMGEKIESQMRSLKLVQYAVDSSSVATYWINPDARITYVNESACRSLGYSKDELVKLPVAEIDPRWPVEHWPERLEKIKSEGSLNFESIHRRKDGSTFPVEVTATFFMFNEVEYIFAFVADITHRKQAEEEIRKLNEDLEKRVEERTAELKKLSETVEQSPVTVVITDKNGTIEYVNPTFCEITGYSAKEAIGQNPRILKSGNNPESFYKDLWDTILSGRVWRGELLNRKKNDEEFWESASISPIKNDDGEITHFVAVKEDITAKKQMEEELIQSKRAADEANKAKSDFVANMSHEIRTPMNAVIGMTHLALKTELTHKQRDYLNKIESSANSLLGIINDILDFSKIEAGKLDIESVEFNLDNVLDNLANLVTVKAQEKEDLEILFATSRKVPRSLVGDPLRLGQILINLANNAVKFTESGEILVSTELVNYNEGQVTLKFSVSDTGIGLTEDQIDNLFQAFTQADTSTTRKFGGTGLGLTISKRLVEMMGGKIWVESQLGQGSTFSFTANFSLGKEKAKERFVPSADLSGMKVLVVDDNANSRQILEKTLDSFSFEVALAASGEEGLAELEGAPKDQPYDLVIMDWKMPGMDGIEASKLIKSHKGLSKIPPIILVTAYAREEIRQRAKQLGLEGFLFKPVSPSVLLDAIMQAMGQEVRKVSRVDRKKEDNAEELNAIRGAWVLLAEDNEINQQVALEILESAGLNVSLAENGQEAVSAVKEKYYDAVLMDIQMPVMSGYEAAGEIRKDERFKDLPIIAMTAHAMAGDERKSLEAGMNGHVTKPIDPDQLFTALLKWIQPNKGAVADRQPDVTFRETALTQEAQAEEGLPESLTGFDLKAGLERLRGNKRLYRKLLLDFGANYGGVADEIREALAAKDFKQAHSLVHNLKGLAGNLAATDLQSASVEIEKLVKGDQKKAPSVKQLDQKLAELENTLYQALESVRTLGVLGEDKAMEPSDEELAVIPVELIQDLPQRLRADAEMGNVSALMTIAEELKARSDSCAPLSERIVQLAEDFDFEGILKLAGELNSQ
jgi:PAS domain S-box-containing protein